MQEVNFSIKTLNDADVFATIGFDGSEDGEEELALIVINSREGRASAEMTAQQLDMLVSALTCIRRQIS